MEDVAPPARGWRWLPLIGYAALMTWSSAHTGGELPRWSIMQHDKLLHTLEYSGLGVLTWFALARLPGRWRWLTAIAVCIVFGVIDEWHQSFVPGRSGNDLGDLTADAVGGTLGASLAALTARWLARRRQTR